MEILILKYLENEKRYWDETKAFFILFEGLLNENIKGKCAGDILSKT